MVLSLLIRVCLAPLSLSFPSIPVSPLLLVKAAAWSCLIDQHQDGVYLLLLLSITVRFLEDICCCLCVKLETFTSMSLVWSSPWQISSYRTCFFIWLLRVVCSAAMSRRGRLPSVFSVLALVAGFVNGFFRASVHFWATIWKITWFFVGRASWTD